MFGNIFKEDYFIENIGKKKWYGIKIMVICLIFINFLSLLTYYAQSIKNNIINITLIIIGFIVLIFGYINFYILKNNYDNYEYFQINNIFIYISLFFLIGLGIIFGIAFGNNTIDNPDVFSDKADYTVINKYILSSVVLWYAMILVILFISL